jgi:hypothetical protein
MKRIRLLVPVLGLVLALLPSSVSAMTYHESVLGVETGPPQPTDLCKSPNSVSSFAGIASGRLDGVFQIAVCHAPLTTSAEIKGGTFVISNGVRTITGMFTSGLVSYVNTAFLGSLCIQTYSVTGTLSSGAFAGTLVHYGSVVGGSCNIFFATISGRATLST